MAAVLCLFVAPTVVGSGPLIDIQSPSDGDAVTSRQVTVLGTASEPTNVLTLSGEDLVHAEMANVRWVNDNLTFRPDMVFVDQFTASLDPAKWIIERDPQNVSIENGALKLNYAWAWPAPSSNGTLVKSTEFQVPEGVDFQATYRMKASTYAYSGGGGGISDGAVSVWQSHLATLAYWAGGVPPSFLKVVADGQVFYNSSGWDIEYHDYSTQYDSRTERYTCYRDADELGGYQMDTMPSIFWFGHTEETGMYDARPVIEVDYVDLWATSGEWLSDPVDMGHHVSLDGADLTWTSNHRADADILTEVRASPDKETWTEWVVVDDNGDLAEPLNGTYLQIRMRMALPGVLKESAHITVSSIALRYRDPLLTVEVRSQAIDWMPAEGLHEWQAQLLLEEDENTVEVRVTDTSGTVNVSSISVVVDTTPPVGTMGIAGDRDYTNNLNVSLVLNATDKYGVDWVDVSHFPDFSRKVRYPYSNRVDWRMSEVEGETHVYVRFVDSHGLFSEMLTDSINYDSFPPHGKVVIEGNAEYTGSDLVRLSLTYSDNVQVERVELSNDANFSDAYLVPKGVTTIEDWYLIEGEDGPREVHIRVTDVAGNVVTGFDGIKLYYPKSVGSVSIDEGAELTGQTVVRLTVDVPYTAGILLMQIANEPTFEGEEWSVLEGEVLWILTEGDGEKTVYARFKDFRQIATIPVTDTIVLDQTPPEVNVTLNDGRLYTTHTRVDGRIAYDDPSGPVRMWVSMDESFNMVKPVDWSETFDFVIPARESDHTIYVRVEDAAGNIGEGSDMVHYATIRPYISLALPDGDVVQTVPRIPVEVTPVDPYGGIHVQVAFDEEPPGDAPWVPLSGLVHVDVPEGTMDGVHTIWVRARNAAGLTTEEAVAIDVTLDNQAPMLLILSPEDGSKLTKKRQEVVLEVEVADSSKVTRLVYSVDDGSPQPIASRYKTQNVTFSEWGEHTIQVVAEDEAGNVAITTSVFTLVDADSKSTGGGAGLIIVILLAIVGAAIVVGYFYNRRFMPGLRSATIHDGDGWEDEWDHPELEACTEEKRPCELPVSAEDPVYKARKEVKSAPPPEPEDLEGTELESVEMPEELRSSSDDEWSEF